MRAVCGCLSEEGDIAERTSHEYGGIFCSGGGKSAELYRVYVLCDHVSGLCDHGREVSAKREKFSEERGRKYVKNFVTRNGSDL